MSLGSLYNKFKKGLGVAKSTSGRTQIGEDEHGNTYWEVKRMTYNQQLLGRVVVPASGEEDDYEPDDIPKLWQAWLRGTKVEPPTEQEMQDEEDRQIIMEYRIGKVDEKEARMRVAEGKVPVLDDSRQKTGGLYIPHSASPEYTSPGTSSLPSTGAAGNYRPGTWKPIGAPGSGKKKDVDNAAFDPRNTYNREGFTPSGGGGGEQQDATSHVEGWVPGQPEPVLKADPVQDLAPEQLVAEAWTPGGGGGGGGKPQLEPPVKKGTFKPQGWTP